MLVKALPQLSSRHGETVCCAGITPYGEFKRLFPVRFRQLSGESSFKRWDLIEYSYRRPTTDTRAESCHVLEDKVKICGRLPEAERARFLDPRVSASAKHAACQGKSLALLRPLNTEFYFRRKPQAVIEKERAIFQKAVAQGSFLDKELEAIEPSPYLSLIHI